MISRRDVFEIRYLASFLR